MPYSDPEEARRKAKERMQRLRGRTSGEQENITPETVTEPSYVNLSTGEISDEPTSGRTDTKGTENMGVKPVLPKVVLPAFPCSVDRIPIDPQWMGVREAILRDPDNLDKLKRISGSLGKLAGEVRYGIEGPTFEELSKVIGQEEAQWPR